MFPQPQVPGIIFVISTFTENPSIHLKAHVWLAILPFRARQAARLFVVRRVGADMTTL